MDCETFKYKQLMKGWVARQHPNTRMKWTLLTKAGKRSYSIKDGRYWRMGSDLSYLFAKQL